LSLTLEDAEHFKTIADDLIAKHEKDGETGLTALLAEMYLYAQNSSQRFMPARTSAAHQTGVGNSQIDFNMVMLAIMAISWAARTRGSKSDAGQCLVHKQGCKEVQDFHRQVYLYWVTTVEGLIAMLKADAPRVPA
jgi:hypothetical protein